MENSADGTIAHASSSFDSQSESNERLDFLLAANAEIARERNLYRREEDFEASLMMSSPISPEKAYGLFGLSLGLLPPAAIFIRLFEYGTNNKFAFVLFLLMNLICAFTGAKMGKVFGNSLSNVERESWSKMLLVAMISGFAWGVITGTAGGALFFGVGALFGLFCAVVIATIAFPFFAVFHRLLERGHLIERKQLLPVAFGTSAVISAYILGM